MFNATRGRLLAFVGLLTLAAFGFYLHFKSTTPVERPSRFPKAPSAFEGDFWMSWNHAERINYLRGMITGYQDGYDRACGWLESSSAGKGKGKDLPDGTYDECLRQRPQFLALDDYEKQMTKFYTDYPTDHDLPLDRFVIMLSGPERKTPQEIHEWLTKLTHQTF